MPNPLHFEILTTVSFTHTYFASNRYMDFVVTPDAETQYLFRRLSLLYKRVPGGFIILYETGDGLERTREDVLKENASFQFSVQNSDRDFLNYTDGIPENISDVVLFFRNNESADEKNHGLMHKKDFFSVDDILHNQRPDKTATDKREFFSKPFAWMEIKLHEELETELFVNFDSKKTIWRYIINSEHLQDLVEPAVIHKDMKEPFTEGMMITLPDGKKCMAFQSKTALPLKNRPTLVFQLVDNYNKDTGRYTRMINKSLPNPNIKLLSLIGHKEGNSKNIFSEILI